MELSALVGQRPSSNQGGGKGGRERSKTAKVKKKMKIVHDRRLRKGKVHRGAVQLLYTIVKKNQQKRGEGRGRKKWVRGQ